ncbi:flagellar hook protein FlgE [Sulfurimonas sp.]
MMTQAFYTGMTGIKANQQAIDVVSDNIANISTVGFRGYEAEFSSLFEDALNTSNGASSVNSSVGAGSSLSATSMMQKSGTLQLSERSTDLAIDGDGWFGIQGEGDPIYTRDGTFTFDANDDLVTYDGFHILGTMGNNVADGVLTEKLAEVALADSGKQEKLRFPKSLSYPPEPTTEAKFLGNIGTLNEVRTIGAGVVDGESNKNHLKLTFTKAAVQTPPGSQWDVVATTETLDGQTIYDTKEGTAEFDAAGALLSTTLTTIDNNGVEVTIDLGSGFDGVVSITNLDITASSIANGTIGGDLVGYDINQNGEVLATFSNGEQSSVGKIAIFHFQNDQGLSRLSGSRFEQSQNSGDPLIFQDDGINYNGAGIVNFKLESSNIDMTYGITELIILQRSFDANSKSITTADQMMQKALNMDA